MVHVAWITLGVCLIFLLVNYWTRRSSSKLNLSSYEEHFNSTLVTLLQPRSLGSLGHQIFADFIVTELHNLGFLTIRDEFKDPFPVSNIVGIMNPDAKHFLLLSCHYDSKYLDEYSEYVGATDGAVSCALLLNVAKNLESFLHNDFLKGKYIGMLLVFFDGHDSLEGITDVTYPLTGSRGFVSSETIPLKQIALVITFNLIGAPNHIYMSRYERTFELHKRMADIEAELRQSGQLSKCHQLFYKLKDHDSDIEDDHYSFFNTGVPVMHVVPHTYPEVWLQEEDNLENLHWPTVRNMNAIITRFVYEFLNNYESGSH